MLFRQRGASDGDARVRCLPRDTPFLGNRFSGSDNAARDEVLPSFSLAKTKMILPLAMCLPPYIVFAANVNVFALGSLGSALIAKIMLLISHHQSHEHPLGQA